LDINAQRQPILNQLVGIQYNVEEMRKFGGTSAQKKEQLHAFK